MPRHPEKPFGLQHVCLLGLAGALSGVGTIYCFRWPEVSGCLFGLTVACYLSLAAGLRSIWKFAVLVLVSGVAFLVSYLMFLPFLAMFPVENLLGSNVLQPRRCRGILAAIGWSSGPLLGAPLVHLLNPAGSTTGLLAGREANNLLSLFVVWQSGMAMMLGLLLKFSRSRGALPSAAAESASLPRMPVRFGQN